MPSSAQNTRDLIRVLAQVFKSRGGAAPVITPADFFVDGDQEAAQTLVNAVAANQRRVRLIEVAQHNMASAIWMYSLALGLNPGVDAARLHLAVTRDAALDDNAFQSDFFCRATDADKKDGNGRRRPQPQRLL
ncbi:MAG: hypothetical protein LBE84_09835 [Planctomycetota bacterium]|jgi:hypothetical protein|nr:hypothetical protein [Planctomycetota bacterium]